MVVFNEEKKEGKKEKKEYTCYFQVKFDIKCNSIVLLICHNMTNRGNFFCTTSKELHINRVFNHIITKPKKHGPWTLSNQHCETMNVSHCDTPLRKI